MNKICYVVTIPETIESFFIPQLQYLSAHGFDVTVVCSPSDSLQVELGTSVRYVPIEIPRGLSIVKSISAIEKLARLFKKEQFDLIQYSTPNAALYASIAAKKINCKVRNYHLMGYRYLGASGMLRFVLKTIEKITCRNSTSIECVSRSNLEIGIQEGFFCREKATVIWNGSTGGVDLKRFNIKFRSKYRDEIRRKYGISPNHFVFGFVGRITRDKGINEILEAFSNIDDAKLLMVGNPEATDTLDQQLYEQSLNNKNIIYTGDVADVEKYYSAIDTLLLPSYREGFGNVIIEAAAMGTTAIISDIPGPIDAVERDKTALVIRPKDADDLVSAMVQMKDGNYIVMGENAVCYVRKHFDCNQLNRHILERKKYLLGKEGITCE